MSSNGLIGTAVNLAILGAGLSLFAGFAGQAQRQLEPQRTQKRRRNGNRNLFDPFPQARQQPRQQRRARRQNDVFNMDFF